jgi:hypothetical protein
VTCHARIGYRRCGTSLPQLSSGPLGGTNNMNLLRFFNIKRLYRIYRLKKEFRLHNIDGLVKIFRLTSKKELIQHCKSLVVYKYDLASIIIAAEQGKSDFMHKIYQRDFVPEHLNPSQNELDSLSKRIPGSPLTGDARKLFRKLSQTFEDRRFLVGHLFFDTDLSHWHFFYFDQRDSTARGNHWRHGAHLHFLNYLWPNRSVDSVWKEFTTGNPNMKDSIHIRFIWDE